MKRDGFELHTRHSMAQVMQTLQDGLTLSRWDGLVSYPISFKLEALSEEMTKFSARLEDGGVAGFIRAEADGGTTLVGRYKRGNPAAFIVFWLAISVAICALSIQFQNAYAAPVAFSFISLGFFAMIYRMNIHFETIRRQSREIQALLEKHLRDG